MSTNVLITGGAGFIGSNLALTLAARGYTVTVLDNLSPQIHGEKPADSVLFKSIEGKVKFIQGDVVHRADWSRALEGQHVVVHLAAETGTGQSMYAIEHYTNVNVNGTAILWDILANQKHTVRKVVVASSRAIYGEGAYRCEDHGIVFPEARKDADMARGDFHVKCPHCGKNSALIATGEEARIHPSSVYGFTKQAQEELSLIAGRSLKIPVVAFRYQNVYGPGQSLNNPYTGILSIFSKQIRGGSAIQIFEDGLESRDFVYVSDVVDATVLGIENEQADFEVFNVGSGVCTDVLTVAKTLVRNFEASVAVNVTGQYRIGDIRHNFADLNKAKEKLGFTPKVEFENGIARFVEWVKTQTLTQDNYQDAMNEMKERNLFK